MTIALDLTNSNESGYEQNEHEHVEAREAATAAGICHLAVDRPQAKTACAETRAAASIA
jgi:hypothetical protein